jgi:hypothetical protein
MAHPTVGANVLQAGDVLLNLPTQLTFHDILAVEDTCQASQLIVREVLGLSLRVQSGLFAETKSQ